MNRNKETAKRLKIARQSAKISLAEFGRLIGRSSRTVARIEAGEISITIEIVDLYSELASVSREHLLLGKEPLSQAIQEIRSVRQEMNEYILGSMVRLTSRIDVLEQTFINEWGVPYENYSQDLKQSIPKSRSKNQK